MIKYITIKPFKTPGQFAEQDLSITYASQDQLLKQSDFVVMLLPFMPETKAMVNQEFIKKMKPGACLVSCGASGLFNEEDVAKALASGYLGGVATDTFAWEPINQDSPLLDLARDPEANIMLTPHTASGSINPNALPDRRGDYINLVSYNLSLIHISEPTRLGMISYAVF